MDWLYQLLLFVHILAPFVLVGAAVTQLVGIILLLTADTKSEVRWVRMSPKMEEVVNIPAALAILLSGIWLGYMQFQAGQSIGWIIVALVWFVAFLALAAMIGKRAGKVFQAEFAKPGEYITPELRETAKRLLMSASVGFAAIIGLLALMLLKPAVFPSLVLTAVSLVIGYGAYRALQKTSLFAKVEAEKAGS